MPDGIIDEDEIAAIAEDLDDGDSVQLIPHGDIADHIESITCHCNPRLIFRDLERRVEIWMHRFLKDIVN